MRRSWASRDLLLVVMDGPELSYIAPDSDSEDDVVFARCFADYEEDFAAGPARRPLAPTALPADAADGQDAGLAATRPAAALTSSGGNSDSCSSRSGGCGGGGSGDAAAVPAHRSVAPAALPAVATAGEAAVSAATGPAAAGISSGDSSDGSSSGGGGGGGGRGIGSGSGSGS